MLDWDNRFSPAGLPATAIGLDRVTRSLMRWAMKDWSRVKKMNLMGTGPPASRSTCCRASTAPGISR